MTTHDSYIIASISAISRVLEMVHSCQNGKASKVDQDLLTKNPAMINFLCCNLSFNSIDFHSIFSFTKALLYLKKCFPYNEDVYEEVLYINENISCHQSSPSNKLISNSLNTIFISSEESGHHLNEPQIIKEDPLSLSAQPSHTLNQNTKQVVIGKNPSLKVPMKIVSSSSKEFQSISDKICKRKYPSKLVCEFCGKTFDGKERAYRFFYHRNKVHMQELAYKCEKCCKVFWGERELYNHYIQIHNDAGHICHICGIKCNREADLLRHLSIHNEKSFTCKFCNKKFRRKDHLSVHERSHTGNMPYICSFCGSGYPQKRQLNLHYKRCPILKIQSNAVSL